MKTKVSRSVSLALPLAPLALAFAGSVAAQANDYYIVDGQRIPLTRSDTYEAVEVKPGTQGAFRSAAGRNPNVRVEPVPILERYDVVLMRKPPAATPGAFNNSVRALNNNNAVESSVPVYKVGSVDQVLVNEFLVQFKASVGQAAAQAFLKEKGAEVIAQPKSITNRYMVRFPDKTPRDALKVVNEIADDEPVQFAEPNFIKLIPQRPHPGSTPAPQAPQPPNAAAPVTPNDPNFAGQWALRNTGTPGVAGADIGARDAWDIERGSNQVTIAIIDEGVDIHHADLKDKIVTPYDATDGDNDQQPNDWDGHGTACAGIATAMTHNHVGIAGVSWNARILPVRIAYSAHPDGPWITTTAVIEDGIRTAVDRGAHVLSNSWGSSPSSVISSAIDYAIAKNRVVVFAAGNDAGPVSYPANLSRTKTLIAVSATNEWDKLKSPTSQDGESWWGSNFGPEITVAAPGVHIQTTDITGAAGYANGDYVMNFNGTSSATPYVAGAAAVLLSAVPSATPAQVRQYLQDGAKDLPPAGFDNQFGAGRLSLLGSLQMRRPPALVSLTVPQGRIGRGQQKGASAKVTVNNAPAAGVTVTFASADTQLATVAPMTALTNSAGVAQMSVRGEQGWRAETVNITASASGATDSKPVKVPAWPLWALFAAGALAAVNRRRG